MDAEGKVALVTGANRGLGRGLAEALARRDFSVLMVCRDDVAGRQAEEDLRAEGLDASLYVADLASTRDVDNLYEAVAEDFDHLDVLVNNAAVLLDRRDTGAFEDMSLEVLQETLDVNVRGPVWMCRRFLPLLRRSESARIINYTSGLGRLTIPHPGSRPAYSISKVAINGLTKVLAAQLEGTDVIVMSVDPGWVRTDMGGEGGLLTIEEGIETALHLATAPADDLRTGRLYRQLQIVPW